MSGGSWDYVYRHFEEAADGLVGSSCIKRRALGILLRDVAKAMHDIEWVDSCDYGQGDEMAAIDAVFKTRKEAIERAVSSRIAELRMDIKALSEALDKLEPTE